ncbi:MAG: DUF4956 domain-containing protein [Clostridia bacterium]|nr:DUF4956 domain-containing protein [Clostridia bacterium]
MNFTEIIKNSVLEEFSGGLTVDKVLISLALTLLLSVFLIIIYKITYRGVSFSTSYVFSLVLLSLVTTVMIMTITSNIVLSLGMVGALSIVRFRTAVKDPVDTAFMYWAISIGIITGAGFYFVAVLSNLILGFIYLIVTFIWRKLETHPYLLTVRFRPEVNSAVRSELKRLKSMRIKAKAVTKNYAEYTVEFRNGGHEIEVSDKFKSIDGVIDVSVVSI